MGSKRKEARMRFHFDLVDGKTIADKSGQELEDAVQASEVADKLAKRLVEEDSSLAARGYSVLVSDEDGEEVYRVKLTELVH
jgi:hypothetical protein